MTKQEQIEEMAKDLENTILGLGIHLCEKSAEKLYDLGYRKVPDDTLILTEKQLKKIIEEEYKEALIGKVVLTAEKLKEKLQNFIYDNEDYDGKLDSGILCVDLIGVIGMNGEIISLGLIDRLLKEYEK